MKYLIFILSIMLSLLLGYKFGEASTHEEIDIKIRSLYLLELELLEMASHSLNRDTTYLQLTTIDDEEKVVKLIQKSSLEGIEKGVKLLSDFSKKLSPKSQIIASERIAESIKLVEKVKNNSLIVSKEK